MPRQVKRGAGHLADMKYLVWFKEVVEGVLDFGSWDSILVRKVTLNDSYVLSDADQRVRLSSGPECLLDVVGSGKMVAMRMCFQYHFDRIPMFDDASNKSVCRLGGDAKQRGFEIQNWVDDGGVFRFGAGHYVLPGTCLSLED